MLRRRPRGIEGEPLRERWRVLVDSGAFWVPLWAHDGSVYVSTGVTYPASALVRLDLATGEQRARVRTRHQGVRATAIHDGLLLAATERRLFALRPDDLSVAAEWSERLVALPSTLLAASGRLLMATWTGPTVGVFDPADGTTKRATVGRQPHLLAHRGEVVVVRGFEGGIARFDVARRRLGDVTPTPPVALAAAGDDVWGVAGGEPDSGGGPPESAWRSATDRLLRLTGTPAEVRLAGPADRIAARGGDVWCSVRGRLLQRVDAARAAVVATYAAGEGERVHGTCPDEGVTFGTVAADPDHAWVVCYDLPA